MEYEIQKTSAGYMVIDPEGDYLHDIEDNNCFNTREECYELIALDKAERE
jgi:hypothetical protein